MRGAHAATNYDASAVSHALQKLQKSHLSSKVMIDCSHGNCQKRFDRQKDVFLNVLEQIEKGSDAICGLMLESHLESGYQPLLAHPSFLKASVSITDPCIDWETTEDLILTAHHAFKTYSSMVMRLTHS